MVDFVINADLVSAVLAVIALLAGAYLVQVKSYLDRVRQLVDDLDDAITDNRITEEEWNRLWNDLKAILGTSAV